MSRYVLCDPDDGHKVHADAPGLHVGYTRCGRYVPWSVSALSALDHDYPRCEVCHPDEKEDEA